MKTTRKFHICSALLAFCAFAQAAEATIFCNLIDEKSQRFCKGDVRFSVACIRTYLLNDETQEFKELNPGHILPDFVVRSWSKEALNLVRIVGTPERQVNQEITTYINRLTGRLTQSSSYINVQSGRQLSEKEMEVYEVEQVKQMGLFGYLDRDPLIAECKAIKRAF